MDIELKNSWKNVLKEETEKEYYVELMSFLDQEYSEKTIYPKKEEVFTAFNLTDYPDVKVVILGQDPYHGEGEAHGLAFSVNHGIKIPPSLRNIYKELNDDLGVEISDNGYLGNWAKQGVLLLNTVLTVEKDKAHSHKKKGWEVFTDEVIKKLSHRDQPIVFVLWGKPAEKKIKLIDEAKHHILISSHPSPLSSYRGFLGCKHFSKDNEILENKYGVSKIDWK